MSKPTLFLRLEGSLQAWGRQYAKWTFRDTGDVPTKSGVVGLICCAMGKRRDDPEMRARDHYAEPQTLLERLNRLEMGVRIDRPGHLILDYHTVGAGYGNMAAHGEIKISHGEYETLVSHRQYLSDASFLVALQGSEEVLAEVRNKLLNPEWLLYLGRKSCSPTLPVISPKDILSSHEDLKEALKSKLWCYRNEIERNESEIIRDQTGDKIK